LELKLMVCERRRVNDILVGRGGGASVDVFRHERQRRKMGEKAKRRGAAEKLMERERRRGLL
jgi:hypothetical protein